MRPRIGLVLSGGGAKGLAHIGVIRTLEELGVPIDVVTGTSMGALVGGLYAAGYDGARIEEIAAGLDWTALFTDRVERRLLAPDRRVAETGAAFMFPFRDGRIGLPSGVVRGESILRLLQRLTWPVQRQHDFTRLPVPFAAVATDIETGEAVTLTGGILAEAMRASIALPGIFDPFRIEGRLLVDGGLARNLPAEDARALGADVLVCSDVSSGPESAERLRTFVDVMLQTVTFLMEAGTEPQRPLCDLLIRPDVEGLTGSDFARLGEWIARGRAAAVLHAPALRDFAGPVALPPPAPRAPGDDAVRVAGVEVRGTRSVEAERVVLRALALRAPGEVGAAAVDEALARLYATNLFARARYRLEASGADSVIVFDVVEQATNQVGMGLRYDDHRQAALLFTGLLRNLLEYGSTLQLDLRLGEQLQFRGSYLSGLGNVSSFSRGAGLGHTRAVFDIYEAGRRIAEVRSRVSAAGVFASVALSRTSVATLRLGAERVELRTSIAAQDTAADATYASLTGVVLRNTFDRRAYPTRGIAVRLQGGAGDDRLGGRPGYTHYLADVEQLLPLSATTVVRAQAVAGAATGGDLPVHLHFFLGGAYPSAVYGETQPRFWGLRPQERAGRAVQVLRLALQQEVRSGFFATAGVNAGATSDEWSVRPRDYLVGWALTLGATTPVGPIELTLHDRFAERTPLLDLSIGYAF